MNSVAAPVIATATTASPFEAPAETTAETTVDATLDATVRGESAMVRRAAKGDGTCFRELFRRYRGPTWQLAQAVAADGDGARAACRDGFVKALRRGRLGRRVGDEFRLVVLSSVYRAAMAQSYERSSSPRLIRRARATGADGALAEAAFRSLPERWRAAVWLAEVEKLDHERIGAVLGVSTGVADQLVARGGQGLAGRFAHARRSLPEHPGQVLRELAPDPPADLAEIVTTRWASGAAKDATPLAPIGAWLEDRAVRPMGAAVGTLVGVGLIALGVVPGGSALRAPLGADGASTNTGSLPVGTAYATGVGRLSPFGGGAAFLTVSFPPGVGGAPLGGTFPSSGFTGGSGASSALTGGGVTGGGAGGGATGGSSGGSSGGSGDVAGGPASSGAAGSTGSGAGTSSGRLGGVSVPSTLNLPGVGTATTSPTGVLRTPTLEVTTPGGSTATINCNGALIQATRCPTTATTTSPLNPVVQVVTGPVTSTVTTVPVVSGGLGQAAQNLTTTVSSLTGSL